jgi:transposase
MENCAAVAEKRYVCDAVIQTSTTEFRKMSIDCCPMGKGRLEGVFPEHVKSHMQYGKNLTAMAVTLNTECALGNDKIHSLIEGLFGIPLSAGTVVNKVSGTALSISGTAQEIKRRIAGEKVVHFDETGTRCEKATKWVHSSSTPMLTYLTMHSKRGEDGVRDNGVMQQLGESSVAVHDCWRTYWKFPNIGRHAVCCVHLLRELKGIEENHPGQAWSGKTSSLLHEMRNYKEDAVSQGLKKADPEKRRRFSEEFDTLVAEGLGMNPLKEPSGEKRRGRPARGKVRAFLERLSEYKDSVFLFIDDFDIPFSNNLAEQSIRMVKVKTKVAGCFRSKTGADDYLKIMSYISTAKKLGASAYEAIRNALDGNSDFIFSLQRC